MGSFIFRSIDASGHVNLSSFLSSIGSLPFPSNTIIRSRSGIIVVLILGFSLGITLNPPKLRADLLDVEVVDQQKEDEEGENEKQSQDRKPDQPVQDEDPSESEASEPEQSETVSSPRNERKDPGSDKMASRGSSDRMSTDQEMSGAGMARAINNSNWIFGVTYPGVTFGYSVSDYAVEMRGFMDSTSTLYGARFTHHGFYMPSGNLYWGVDGLLVKEFEGEITEGNGIMGGVVGGMKIYVNKFSSFDVDAGPYYVELNDDWSGVSVDSVEFVVNMGLNFHF